MASRTRQCLSSANSSMAGSSDCASRSTPMTWFTCSSEYMVKYISTGMVHDSTGMVHSVAAAGGVGLRCRD
jgi:hypothetical protein